MSDNEELIKVATELQRDFLHVADILDKVVKNVNITRITGNVVAIFGAAIALAATIAIPFTFGIAIPIAIGGAAVSTVGGVTTAGAIVTRFFISKKRMKRMNKRWTNFKTQYGPQLAQMQRSHETLGQQVSTVAGAGRMIIDVAQTCKSVAARAGADAAAHAAVTPVYVFHALTSSMVIMNVAQLGLSISDLVAASLEFHRQKKSPAGDILRNLAKALDAVIKGKCTLCGQEEC